MLKDVTLSAMTNGDTYQKPVEEERRERLEVPLDTQGRRRTRWIFSRINFSSMKSTPFVKLPELPLKSLLCAYHQL